MTRQKLRQAEDDIRRNRPEIIAKMVEFLKTDTLLYWDTHSGLAKRQAEIWGPVLNWARTEMSMDCVPAENFEVPRQEEASVAGFRRFLESLSDKELAAFYLAALNTHSELLAAALVKGKVSAAEAFEAANLEELWQAEAWGKDEQAEKRRQLLLKELEEVEAFLRE